MFVERFGVYALEVVVYEELVPVRMEPVWVFGIMKSSKVTTGSSFGAQ